MLRGPYSISGGYRKWLCALSYSLQSFSVHTTQHLLIFTARRTMQMQLHYSATVERAVLRLHVVRRSICDVGGLRAHTLEILETNCTDTQPNTFTLRSPKAIHLLLGVGGEKQGQCKWKSGVLEHKSSNISETDKDTGNLEKFVPICEISRQENFMKFYISTYRLQAPSNFKSYYAI